MHSDTVQVCLSLIRQSYNHFLSIAHYSITTSDSCLYTAARLSFLLARCTIGSICKQLLLHMLMLLQHVAVTALLLLIMFDLLLAYMRWLQLRIYTATLAE
jgi:hypothetical protein